LRPHIRIVKQFTKNLWSNSIWAGDGFRRDHGHCSWMYVKRGDVYVYFKHEDTPEGALNAESLLRATVING